ncbi:uncharacterized protein LOC110013067 [Sesamum indicum]|uniref:Uncharacterized protein LOC110013067 n=1 Tax=Sesamum indicum TaxID=4182 RepID=A0A8M8V5H6_SESIN|nr:uncharacterized protein LOC110013067 [Sesamum indicum]
MVRELARWKQRRVAWGVLDEDDDAFLKKSLVNSSSCVPGFLAFREVAFGEEKAETVEDENEHGEEERDGKRLRIEKGELSEKEEKEQQEANKIRIQEGELSDEGLLRAVRSLWSSSLSSIELESEIETAPSPPKKNNTVVGNNKNDGKRSTENRQLPWRIESGMFSRITPELLFHILKFLSSEDLVSCSMVCRFLKFASADESLWRRLLVLFPLLPFYQPQPPHPQTKKSKKKKKNKNRAWSNRGDFLPFY